MATWKDTKLDLPCQAWVAGENAPAQNVMAATLKINGLSKTGAQLERKKKEFSCSYEVARPYMDKIDLVF